MADASAALEALLAAAKKGDWKAYKDLLAAPALNVAVLNAVPVNRDYGVIHQLAYWGNVEALQQTLARFPTLNLSLLTSKGSRTPLQVAQETKHQAFIDFLRPHLERVAPPPPPETKAPLEPAVEVPLHFSTTYMAEMNEGRFAQKLAAALVSVKKVLDTNRNPVLADSVQHQYVDKFGLAEFLTKSAVASHLVALQGIGINDAALDRLLEWARNRSVTLRFNATENCVYDREQIRTERSPTSYTEKSVAGTVVNTIKSFIETKITEYIWKFDVQWEIVAYKGNDPTDRLVVQQRKGQCEIVTGSSVHSPRSKVNVLPAIEADLSWLLRRIKQARSVSFSIDRTLKSCHTPRRNTDVDAALNYFASFGKFAKGIENYIVRSLFPVQVNHGLDLNAINANDVFIPVLALFEQSQAQSDTKQPAPEAEVWTNITCDSCGMKPLVGIRYKCTVCPNFDLCAACETKEAWKGKVKVPHEAGHPTIKMREVPKVNPAGAAPVPVLSLGDLQKCLQEQQRSLHEKLLVMDTTFPSNASIITNREARVVVSLIHNLSVAEQHADAIDHIETMLRNQVIAAIGKEVTPNDFTEYMEFHNRKVFNENFWPAGFSYPIRRPDHFPEGIISIEANNGTGEMQQPLPTMVRRSMASQPMSLPINAATKVTFFGDRYLHAFVLHRFTGQAPLQLNFCARARQFSSFIMLLGTIPSANVFEPKQGIIIQNKDDLAVPLLMNTIPTPKEFKDAIQSLSPEQQRFCKAFRSMQLASTLFGVCIIQIKPQMEILLKLPDDALTKEIKLTQDLMELFIKYQIPSDLLSFDGNPQESKDRKLQVVKGHVQTLQAMIQRTKQEELHSSAQTYVARVLDRGSMSNDSEDEACDDGEGMDMNSPGGDGSYHTLGGGGGGGSYGARSAAPPVGKGGGGGGGSAGTGTATQEQKAETDSGLEVKADKDDITAIPKRLDRAFEAFDEDSALRPTIIKSGETWSFSSMNGGLIGKPTTTMLGAEEQRIHRNKAFDLLDALSKSGILPIHQASLHILLAATHCFDKTLMDTVIQDNINPIEKVERSSLIVASTIQGVPAAGLLRPEHVTRVKELSPKLFN